jgi:HAMP domain-containing protein
MNLADVLVLMMLAAADICLMVHLRRRRARYIRMDRMTRSLQLHIRSEVTAGSVVVNRRPRVLAMR